MRHGAAKRISAPIALAVLLGNGALAQAPKGANVNHAEARFRLGRFAEADAMAAAVLERQPDDFRATLLRARVALLANRLDDAASWSGRALELRPTHRAPKEIQAEVHTRHDDLERAATVLDSLGAEARVAQLRSFEGRRPYAVEGERRGTELPFVRTDPLPVVRLRVNGSEPAAFLIDTGGGELILDSEWATELGVEELGRDQGTFGGGKRATYGRARADSVTLGSLVVRDVPVQLLDTKPFSAAAPGETIRGVLGTVLLYHFRATIDYAGGRLVLEPRGTPGDDVEPPLARIPFWLAGSHLVLAEGQVNRGDPLLVLVDTGLAGLGFTCPESTLEDAGIELVESAAAEGVGGGGAVRIVPFVLERLALGPLAREQIPGVWGPFPPRLEHSRGFRIGGLISHAFFRPWAVTFDFESMEIVVR